MAIANFLKSAFQWLSNIINICNKELGTPFQRCMRVMDNAIVDCNAKLGPMFSWLCSATYVAKGLCYLVKWMDFICMLLDFVNDSVVGVIIKKINIFMRHIRAIFYIKVKFSHSFKFQTSQSKSMTEVTHGIITEIGERIENLLTVFDLMSSLTSLFFLFIFFKVLYYRYNFLTNETFDNHFITKYLHEIDMNRAKLEKETIFPLNQREKQQYIQLSSLRLLKEERTSLSKSAIILSIAILKLCIHMMADYCLYWMLAMIRRIGGYQTSIETPNTVTLHVEGNGFLADLYRSIIKAFQPVGVKIDFDTVPCLPDPIPPDYDRYFQIVSLVILCWILAICEPYGLRLRYSVMSYYHPDRAKHRSVWLYNHILRRRMNFLQFARRKLRQKFKNTSKDTEHITWSDYLKEHVNNKCVRYLFGIETNKACIVCGTVQTEKNRNNFIQCMKPNCVGFYCFDCYKDLGNMCTICMEPTDYGDFSDFSEEVDSSDDENSKKLQTLYKMRKYTASKQINLDDSNKNHNTENYEHESDKSDSSNYSYSYQSDKNTSQPTIVSRTSFVDLEKQIIPDYASMESYKKSSSLTNTSLSNISSLEYSDIENKNEDVLKTPRLKTIFRKNKPTLESDSSTLSASEEDERRQTQPFLKRNPRINKRSNKYKSEQKTSNFILKRIVNIVDNFKKYFFKHKKHTNVSPSNIHKINKLHKLNASKNWDSDNDLSDNTRTHLSEYNSSKKYSDTEGSLTSRDNLLTKSSRFESHSDSNKDLKNYHNRDNVLLRDVHYEVVDEQSPRFARRQLSNKKCYISKCCNQAVKDKYTEPLNYMSPDSDIELTDRSKSERYYDDSDSLNNSNTLTTVNVKESHRHSIPSTYSNKNLKFNTSSSYLSDLNIDGSDLSTLNTSRRNSSTQATSADLKNKESKDCNGTNTDYDTFSEFKLIDLNDSSNISNDIKNSSRSNGSRKSVLRSKRKNN